MEAAKKDNYIKNNYYRKEIKISKKYDPDIVEFLKSKKNFTEYIKKLIIDDMKKSNINK